MKKPDLDFTSIKFRESNGLSNSINHAALPFHSPGRELVRKWQINQIYEMINLAHRAEWMD